jgi:hypothetical protein
MREPTLKQIASERPELVAWVKENKRRLCDALGLGCSDETLILLLIKLTDSPIFRGLDRLGPDE